MLNKNKRFLKSILLNIMKFNKILVFTATYNEVENIAKYLKEILSLNIKLSILIIDDNSPDKTYEEIRTFEKI